MTTFTQNNLAYSPRLAELTSSGGLVAFAMKELDEAKSTSKFNIWLTRADNLEIKQLTRAPWGTNKVQASFLKTEPFLEEADALLYGSAGKVFCLPLSGGEANEIWKCALPIQSYKAFRDGSGQLKIIGQIEVFPSKTISETVTANQIPANAPTGQHYNKLMVRHWNTWGAYDKRHHLFIRSLHVQSDGSFAVNEGEDEIDLLYGLETDCPGKGPGEDSADYNISPDGHFVVIACRRTTADGKQPSSMSWSTDVAIYLAELTNLTARQPLPWQIISDPESEVYHSAPSFSPDGRIIAFLGMKRPVYESDRNRIILYNTESNQRFVVTEDLDLSFSSLHWDPFKPNVIYAVAGYHAVNRIFRLTFSSDYSSVASIEVMIGDESRSSVQVVVEQFLYFTESTLLSPPQLKRVSLHTNNDVFVPFAPILSSAVGVKEIVSVSEVEDSKVETIFCPVPEVLNGDFAMPQLQQYYIPGANNDAVQCWYMTPPDIDTSALASKSLPLVLIIHGGPQGALLNAWNYRWNLATFASKGYAVLAMNFHGSSTFGDEFCDSIRRDWGGKPFEDVMLSLDYILAQHSYLDGNRVGALGASYGGYMINWINGHTNRFQCLVNHAGIYSLNSECTTTEELWFPEWEFGYPWTNPEEYKKWSPEHFVANWQTPTLVIHGGKDFRVPETEGIATFTALQRKGIPSEFLYFPDECHWVLKPQNSVQWYSTVFAWLEKWLKTESK